MIPDGEDQEEEKALTLTGSGSVTRSRSITPPGLSYTTLQKDMEIQPR